MSIKVKKNEDLRGKIKVSLPITDYNLGYKHHLNITDEEILEFMGKKVFFGEEAPKAVVSKKRQEQTTWTREQLIEHSRIDLMPLVPDEFEFIPREYWCDFKELLGSNLNNESHPVWQLSHRVIKDNYIKHSDTMLLQACGNYKPYIDNPIYQYTLKKYREGYFDLFVSSWELVPIDFSPFFPWRFYDWSHAKETPFMTDCCITHEVRNIADFVSHFGYKRIIIFAPGGSDYFYNELYKRLKKIYDGSQVELLFILNEEVFKQTCIDYPHMTEGQVSWMFKARYNNVPRGREYLEKLINYDPNRVISPENWNYGIENKELIQWLRGDKERNWMPKEYLKEHPNIGLAAPIIETEDTHDWIIPPYTKNEDGDLVEDTECCDDQFDPRAESLVKYPDKDKVNKKGRGGRKHSHLMDYYLDSVVDVEYRGFKLKEIVKLLKGLGSDYSDSYMAKYITSATENYEKDKNFKLNKSYFYLKDGLYYFK